MRLRYKLLVVSILLFLLASLGFLYLSNLSKWEHNLSFKIGDAVYVRYGLYEGCVGTILQESYSDPTVSRYGEHFSRAFAGYIVDLTCKQKEVGNRFFSVDFLRHSK